MADNNINRRISLYLETADVETKIERLRVQQNKYTDAVKKTKYGTDEWKKATDQLNKANDQIRYYELQLSGKLGPTLEELKQQQRRLNKIVSELPIEVQRASKEFQALQNVNRLLDQHSLKVKKSRDSWADFKNQVKAGALGVLGGNLMTAGLNAALGYVSDSIDRAAKLSDDLADIRKTTGLTADEVERLNKEFGKLDTRTASGELRKIAIVAGQFGIPKDQILGFVESVDKVNIALGDEFGGNAQNIAETMAKLRNVFSDIKSSDIGNDITFISNAINKLGAEGLATGPVVSDFANRIGGVTIPLGVTSGEVLGLSATLQELSVNTERGGTAVTRIFQKMLTNTEDFAKVAGMDVKTFTKLLNTDLFGAFMKVVEGSQKSGKSATVLAGIIKELDVDGAGASEVFAKLGTNMGLLRNKVDLANKALTESNSITDEANLKNGNFAAQIEKLSKKWEKLKNSSTVNMVIKWGIEGADWVLDFIDSLKYGALAGGVTFLKRNAVEIENTQKEMNLKMEEERRRYVQEIQKMGEEELRDELNVQKERRKIYFQEEQEARASGNRQLYNKKKKLWEEANTYFHAVESEIKARKDANSAIEQLTEEEIKARKAALTKQAKDFEDYLKDLARLREEVFQKGLSADDREIRQLKLKYDEFKKRAKQHKQDLTELLNLEYTETMLVYDRQIDEARKKYDKDTENFIKNEREKTQKLREENRKRIEQGYRNEIGKFAAQGVNAEINFNANAGNFEDVLEAEKLKLESERQLKLEQEGITLGEIEAINAEHKLRMQSIDDELLDYRIQNTLAFADAFAGMIDAIGQMRANFDQSIINRDEAVNRKLSKEAEKQKNAELKFLDQKKTQGLITEEEYAAQKDAIDTKYKNAEENRDADLDRKKASLKRDQAERDKRSAIFSTIINTAAAIIGMLANPGGLAGVGLSIMAGITGLAQLAAIASTPVPQYFGGGKTKVTGAIDGQSYNATRVGTFSGGGSYGAPSVGLIGEKGTELVIPNWLYTDPKMQNNMKMLEYMIYNKTSTMPNSNNTSGGGGFTNYSSTNNNDQIMQALAQMQQNIMASDERQMMMFKTMIDVLTSGKIQAAIVYEQMEESLVKMDKIRRDAGLPGILNIDYKNDFTATQYLGGYKK